MYIYGKWYTEIEVQAYVQEIMQLLQDSQQLLINALFVSSSEYKAAAELCKKIGAL